MNSLPQQIQSAVAIALSTDPSPQQQQQRAEAHQFLSDVKLAHADTWQACLELFLAEQDDGAANANGNGNGAAVEGARSRTGKGRATSQARMFALQVVGDSLPKLTPEALAFVQSSLFQYFAAEYVNGPAEDGVSYLKNASYHLATLLFLQIYPTQCPTFFSTFISLLHPPSSPTYLYPPTTSLFLHLLHEVSAEIGDAQLRLNKERGRLNRDAELRDAMRTSGDAVRVAEKLWEVVREGLEALKSGEGVREGMGGDVAREMTEMAVRVLGEYVSWIDINLTITPTSIPLLLSLLSLPPTLDPSYKIRSVTLETLHETVSKGMPAEDKVALLRVLDVGELVRGLLGEGGAEVGVRGEGDERERWEEKCARLVGAAGGEMCRVCDEVSLEFGGGEEIVDSWKGELILCWLLRFKPTADAASKATALTMSTSLQPLLLQFLSSSSPAISSAISPFASSLLALYKKDKKRSTPNDATYERLSSERRGFLRALLQVTFAKMEYAENVEWELGEEGEEDEEELVFNEMRKNLRTISEAIAYLDGPLYSDATRSLVTATIDQFELETTAAGKSTTVPGLSWQRLELVLNLIYGFGQAVSSTGPGAFVQVPPTEIQRARQQTDYKIDYTQFPLSQLGEMMLRACRAKIVEHPHPAVSLQFFEIAVRYHEFFRLCPEYIVELLPAFLGEHGIHQMEKTVQCRMLYLFSRFVHQAKGIVQSQVSGELVSNVLARLQDLLPIQATLIPDEPVTEELLNKSARTPTFFDSQLYLFEAVGTLISILNQIPDQQVALLSAILAPLLSGLQANRRSTATSDEDYAAVLKAHYFIMAIGNVAKGFPDLSPRAPTAVGGWVEVFKEATEQVLITAKEMAGFVVIRDASRFAFNRIVATTGEAVLLLIPTLIDCLIEQITFPELADLLGFLGLLVAKYRVTFVPYLDTLIMPVFNRVFYFLKLEISGTDDIIQHSSLRRAYFGFILCIANSNLQEVLYSPTNKPHLSSILQSVTHYISHDSLASDQRFGFVVLNKFLSLWVTPYRPSTAPPPAVVLPPSPVPGFEQFLYAEAVKLCFEVPLKPSFDYSDAQSFQVIQEIAYLLKGLLQKRGVEFVEFMTTTLLPSIQCPPESAQAFMKALQEAPDGKQFKKFAAEWLQASRGSN